MARRPRQDRTGGMMRNAIELVGAILALALILHLLGF